MKILKPVAALSLVLVALALPACSGPTGPNPAGNLKKLKQQVEDMNKKTEDVLQEIDNSKQPAKEPKDQ